MPVTDYPSNNGGASINAVRTNSIALFATDGTMLRIAFSNDTMFLTIIPRVPDPSGGKPRWPREMGHTANFRPHTALALYKAIDQVLLPDIAEGKDHNGYCVVPLNREATTLCGFTFAGGHVIFSIFNDVAADHTCSAQYNYIFEPTVIIDDYKPATGEFRPTEVQGQFYVIAEALRVYGSTGSNAIGHGVKNATSWLSDGYMSYLRAIAAKVGATPGQYGSYRGGYGDDGPSMGGGNNWGSNSSMNWQTGSAVAATVGQGMAPQVQQVSSLTDLMGGAMTPAEPGSSDLPF